MRRLIVGAKHQYETLVSDEDFLFLVRNLWTFKRSSKKYAYAVYARRCVRVGGRKKTILLAHVILERMGRPRPSPVHSSEHLNGETLDNQRHNLTWATAKEQRANRTARRIAAGQFKEAA